MRLDAPPIAALSYTQVDTYLRCPQMYQYRFVFRLPTRPRPQMQFGRILHEDFARHRDELSAAPAKAASLPATVP